MDITKDGLFFGTPTITLNMTDITFVVRDNNGIEKKRKCFLQNKYGYFKPRCGVPVLLLVLLSLRVGPTRLGGKSRP